MSSVQTHVLGFPRIGARRELKHALESYWRGDIPREELLDTGRALRQRHWQWQAQAGMDRVTVGDFSFYDHVLDMAQTLGVLPSRFQNAATQHRLDQGFYMARGRSSDPTLPDVPALEMTKWFDTNYHYLVPELTSDQSFFCQPHTLVEEIREAQALGLEPKPVILGPLSFLYLSRVKGQGDRLDLLNKLIPIYQELLEHIATQGVTWVQVDEPILALDLTCAWQRAFETAYQALKGGGPRILLASYFGSLGQHLPWVLQLPVAGLHVDAVRGAGELDPVVAGLPLDKVLSVGIVDGRNVWANNLETSLGRLAPVSEELGQRLWVSSSCSLLHVPLDLDLESELDGEIQGWLAFAKQKLQEIQWLRLGLVEGREAVVGPLARRRAALEARWRSTRVHHSEVRDRARRVTEDQTRRQSAYPLRAAAQRARLNLPPLPTTTIGSFPQTHDIRRIRKAFRSGKCTSADYEQAMQAEIERVIRYQEQVGLDLLVHGEPERNDMVEYFGEQLAGYAFTRHGWVQSYGSRCVKPPVIYGDVHRPRPMTVEWSRQAQSLTNRPVKGMLTGPVTMLQWAFVRDDQPRSETALQIALALRDEINDLAAAGIPAIQVDEPAFREGLPLRRGDWDAYLTWAIRVFRLATGGVGDDVQIHTHMCYSEFNDIMDAIAGLDADVITIETSRSDMALLDAFEQSTYPNEIGPGVYDIHSPRVPETRDMIELMQKAMALIPAERLWVNPDCGLKTRDWDEVKPALARMVEAAKVLRNQVSREALTSAEAS
ncbi:5-methyltetrahydropteroyltriglutamate--homocysteine S-methyltransferase [Ectothiorhodospira sp. BSL-9]|uniref:5-methyltetrahydropteroyltriglutamate-- homocysteine S-methyltransferase n=1 Tax=Ectothiorhodospira sp. BSL-9 TaxID=1442136 RepID=UPI0007B444D1|nr:5-methyltetrahydropteroyltriglutamate--homocysteine S-methyltransferase [Ectothiorhodospira sp. BSL-9]ANB03300.1 5-methyltetrahydropteroyltriglutamate--homocysteine methyltransferase [Ectothiorhodospira sp. BSL-9]